MQIYFSLLYNMVDWKTFRISEFGIRFGKLKCAAWGNERYYCADFAEFVSGTIDWSENNFHGDARWEYEMVFADDFVTIAGGQMSGFDSAGVFVCVGLCVCVDVGGSVCVCVCVCVCA